MAKAQSINSIQQKIDKLNQQAWEIRVFDSPKSLGLSQRSLKLARANNYKRGIAEATRSIGFSYVRRSKNDEAIPVLKESMKLFKELRDLRGQAVVTEYFGIIKRNQGNYGSALQHFFKAVALSKQTGVTEDEAIHHYQIGVTNKYLGNFDKALEALYKSLLIHKENKNRLYQSYNIHIIGTIYFETGEYKKALEYLQDALKMRQESKDKLGEAGSLDTIGYTLFKLKKYTAALRYCQRALSISKKTGDKRSQANALQHQAEIYAGIGKTKEAIHFSNESRKIRKLTGDKNGEAEILLFLAGLPGQEQKQVFRWIEEAMKIAKETRTPAIQSKAHHALYESYTKQGDFKKANAHLEKHFTLEKELQKNSVNQKMANLEISRKAEEASEEAELMARKNDQLLRLNKELEIESALERVRAIAMSMKRAEDMLSICKAISKELEKLGVKEIRNIQTAIIYPDRGTYMNYQYYAKHDRTFITDTVYTNHIVAKRFVNKMLKGKGQFSITHIRGKQKLKDWINYQKGTNVFLDTYLYKAESLHYYWHSLGPVALGISTYVELEDEEKNLFQRFLNVFELSYRRYLDIEKAEAQAREAQIEASLERVRSKTMAMHRSEEVTGIAVSLNEELLKLGFKGGSTIVIIDKTTGDTNQWTGFSEDKTLRSCYVPYFDHPYHFALLKGWKAGDKFLVYTVEGDEKPPLDKHYFSTGYKIFPDNDKKWMRAMKSVTFSHAFMKYGAIHWGPDHLTPEQLQVLHRFSKVFEQSYTRFLDLQKAEEQAREAKIEAALERVRARSLAMRSSNELAEVVGLLYKQFEELDFGLYQILVSIIDRKNNVIEWWSRGFNQAESAKCYLIPLIDHPFPNTQKKIWDSGVDFHAHVLGGKVKESWEEYLFTKTELKDLPKNLKDQMRSLKKVYLSDAFMKYGCLQAAGPLPLPEEKVTILKRFAKVLDQAYTRMIDLLNAESQAREAQIQLALERVRARTLAMQHSGELAETVSVMFEQFKSLGESPERMAIEIVNEKEHVFEIWATQHGGSQLNFLLKASLDEPFVMKKMYKAWKEKISSITIDLQGDELEGYFNYLKKAGLPVDRKIFGKRRVQNVATFSKGILTIITPDPRPASTIRILERFASVFDGTYTRFLDLQKAEAQAQEAQIEVALERVRSAAMAMHRSDELKNVVNVVFSGLRSLGLQGIDSVNINIFHGKSKDFDLWLAAADQNYTHKFHLPYYDHPIVNDFFDSRAKGLTLHAKSYSFEVKNDYFSYMFENSDNRFLPEERKKLVLAGPGYAVSAPINRYSALFVNNYSGKPFSDSDNEIFIRFARVFEQGYTRFLDLQKAEAQAREAQIEAGLERVRSRTMAMHNSNDLLHVTKILSEQLVLLGFDPNDKISFITDSDSSGYNMWLSSEEDNFLRKIYVPRIDDKSARIYKQAIEQQLDFYTYVLSKNEKDLFFKNFFENTVLSSHDAESKKVVYDAPGMASTMVLLDKIILSVSNFRAIPFTDEQNGIIKRFAFVFQQSYTRYLDLKKAEAQGREAQIEASLERVRSASMAMHVSDELTNVIKVLTDQLTVLGFGFHTANFITNASMPDWEIWISSPGSNIPPKLFVPYFDHRLFNERNDAVASGKEMLTSVMSPEEKESFLNYFFEHSIAKDTEEERKKWVLAQPGMALTTVVSKSFSLTVINYFGTPFSDAENEIIKRLAAVFEQSYTRFLDLKKAEAQARESEIELALERVRASAMAMQSPSEFVDVVTVIGEQFVHLGFDIEWVNFGANGLDISAGIDTWNFAVVPGSAPVSSRLFIPRFDHPLFDEAIEHLHQYLSTGKDLFELAYNKEEKDKWLDHLFSRSVFKDVPEEYRTIQYAKPGYITSNLFLKDTFLSIGKFDTRSFTAEQHSILRRFGNAFGQAFTRFLDLQKSEAQARESQIELGLERVRARAMAMQKSDELKELIGTVFAELSKLDLILTRCVIMIYDIHSNASHWWMAHSEDPDNPSGFYIKAHDHDPINTYYEAWKQKRLKFTYVLEGATKVKWDDFLFTETDLRSLPSFVIQGMRSPEKVYLNASFNNFGNLTLASLDPLSDEHFDILLRFAKVFDLTYTRFNDLQLAEAQAREAKIEAALERVRSKAMAMHKSEDLQEAVGVMFEEMDKLDLGMLRVGISVLNKEKRCGTVWLTSVDEGGSVQVSGNEPFDIHPLLSGAFDAWLEQKDFYYKLEGEDLLAYYKAVDNARFRLPVSQIITSNDQSGQQYCFTAVYNSGGLFAFRASEFSAEAKSIMKRFANVFDLTYKRFLDLQKAEAQAKEAQVEASLERVRAKAMAMHSSQDLADTIGVFYKELKNFSFTPIRCGVGLLNKESKVGELYTWNTTEQGHSLELVGKLKMEGHPILENVYTNWIMQKEYHPVLRGNEIPEYYKIIRPQMGFPNYEDDVVQYGYFFFFKEGGVYAWTENEMKEEELQIYRRFKSVLSLTYKRYKDLKDAEAKTRESQIEAALERVRAKVIAMQSSSELQNISYVFGDQMRQLKIDWQFSYFWLIEENKNANTFWITWPDNHTSVTEYSLNETDDYTRECLIVWKEGKLMHSHHIPENGVSHFLQTFKKLANDAGSSAANIMQRSNFPNGVYNYDAMMRYGSFGVCMNKEATEEETSIQSRFAVEFERAYTRFLDLKQAELLARKAEEDLIQLKIEKSRTEEALQELKAAQSQLIQAEKMASLGELTAGIAHEIQNPLNFVNNFSEVSNELLDEMIEEVRKGNYEEVAALVNDVKQNLEKIAHHGKRADGIVKGMLQHSRSSSGQKELVDMNTLADEYLRLAYHGLRAKDKTFNAKFELKSDPSVGKINVVPQDIGRVMLNLITNAFHAVSERRKLNEENYNPAVTLFVSQKDGQLEIKVMDNGTGIPSRVLDKIFQPFFTTKPTGQGTGLGLSLSYDIVKAHGGQLRVETKEGEGSAFIIQLPAKQQ